MGLRDFLLGAQQFAEGTKGAREAVDLEKKQIAASQLREMAPSIMENLRSGAVDTQQAGQALAQFQQAGMTNDPMYEALVGQLIGSKKPSTKGEPLTEEAIDLAYSNIDYGKRQAAKKVKDLNAQLKILEGGEVSKRSEKNLGVRVGTIDIKNYQDFNKSLEGAESKFDDAAKGLQAALAQFKANPNKSSLQQLAVSMARAGGDTGVLSNQDLAAYKLSTIAQDFESFANWASDQTDDAIVDSVKKSLVDMGEFALQKSEERKKNRLKSLFENQSAVFGDKFLRGEKPDVMKNWEKRLGLQAKKTDAGVEVVRSKSEYKGKAAELMNLAEKTKDPAKIAWAKRQLDNLGGKQIGPTGEKAFRAKMGLGE